LGPDESHDMRPCPVHPEPLLPLAGDARACVGEAKLDVFGTVIGTLGNSGGSTPTVSAQSESVADVEPPESPAERTRPAFTAEVYVKEGEALGVCFDVTPKDRLRISAIDDAGVIGKYNAAAPEDQRLMEGDFIWSVNGETGLARTKMDAMRAGGCLLLGIRRAHTFVANGVKTEKGNLGLDLTFLLQSKAVYVEKVLSGSVVDEHNCRHPERAVSADDLIVAVNGRSGSSRDIVRLLSSGKVHELTVTRPSEVSRSDG